MAYEESLRNITMVSETDESANQYRFQKAGTTGSTVQDTAGGLCIGVLQNKPIATHAATIGIYGVSKVVAGAAVAFGANVQSDTTGRAITAASADYSQGMALQAAAAAGEIIPVLLRPQSQLN